MSTARLPAARQRRHFQLMTRRVKSPKVEKQGPLGTTDSAVHQGRRLEGVDLLRGIAILLVLLNHVNMRLVLAHIPYGNALPPLILSRLIWNGQRGVQMFFAISGFLITSISLNRWGNLSHVHIREFYRLRVARIAPLLLLVLLVLSVLDLAHVTNYVIPSTTGGLRAALIAALTFQLNVLEARHGYLPGSWDVLWSLSVEETFYCFFPLICWAFGARKRLFVAVMLVFVAFGPLARAVLTSGDPIWHEYSYLAGMDAIALGCLTALALPHLRLRRHQIWLTGLLGTALLSATLGLRLRVLAHTGLDMSIVAIGTCLIIMANHLGTWRSPAALRPLVSLGRRSYETYLTHMFVVFTFFGIFLRLGKPAYAVPLLFIAVIIVAGFLGTLTARLYSEPLNALLRIQWSVDHRSNDGPPPVVERVVNG